MGLSDGERFDGVCNCLAAMHKLYGFKGYEFKHLNPLLKKLWPAFLGAKGNSSHWFTGGSFDSDYFYELNLV